MRLNVGSERAMPVVDVGSASYGAETAVIRLSIYYVAEG